MLYEISKELGTALAARGVPLKVIYGPERVSSSVPVSGAGERIVVERDREGGDTINPARSQARNPTIRGIRAIGAILRVYAKSNVHGAAVQDHERRADHVVDRIHVALDNVIRGARKTLWTVSSSKLLTAEELQQRGIESWSGVVYEIRFAVDRGVPDRAWPTTSDEVGAAKEEATLEAIGNETKVSAQGAANDDPSNPPVTAVTSCGGG